MKNKNKSTIIYVIAGVLIGYVSFLLNNEFLALGLALVSLFLIAEILKKALKIDSKFKWFWSNGGWIYLFIWFITWVLVWNQPFAL